MFTYREKHEQANREALATVIGLLVTAVVWVVCGFGLSALDVEIYHTPLWVIGGTLGTWACATAVSVVLARRIFVDFDLDEAPAKTSDSAGARETSGEVRHG